MVMVMLFAGSHVIAQGSGKVTLSADIESIEPVHGIQVTILDMNTKEIIQRTEINSRLYCILALENRYMIYFKKTGLPSARIAVDTRNADVADHNMHVKINLSEESILAEGSISQSAGELTFNSVSGLFTLQSGVPGVGELDYYNKVTSTPSF